MENCVNKVKYIECNNLSTESDLGEIVFTDHLNTADLLEYCIKKKISHIVQKSNLDHLKEILVAENMLQKKDIFFKYPMSIIYGEENPNEITEDKLKKISFNISKVEDKLTILTDLEKYITSFSKSSTLLCDILNTADELFTNAIYNAPYVTFDNNKSGIDRNFENVVIETNKKPHFFAGHDENRIIVGCVDQYGSLNIEKLLLRIKRCYEANLSKVINYGSGGAGIGAYLIFESSSSLYISVKKGQQTLICASFPYKMNANKRSQIPKNLHIFNA